MQSRGPGIVLIATANCENAINARSIKDLVIVSPVKPNVPRFIQVSRRTDQSLIKLCQRSISCPRRDGNLDRIFISNKRNLPIEESSSVKRAIGAAIRVR